MVTVLGMTMLESEVAPEKAPSLISVTLSGMTTLESEFAPKNAPLLMVVTLLGIKNSVASLPAGKAIKFDLSSLNRTPI